MLLLQLAAAADTLIVRQLPPVRTGFEATVFVLSGVATLLALVLMVVAIWILLSLRARAEESRVRMDALMLKAGEMIDDVRVTAQHTNEILEGSRDTIRYADEKVRHSVALLTDRVDDVSALIGRVHDAASRVETVATTTVAGIKFGARALGLSKRKKRKATKKKSSGRPRLRRQD